MRNKTSIVLQCVMAVAMFAVIAGCESFKNNVNQLSMPVVVQEPDWIRNGEPIEFEGEKWYPQDGFDVLLDTEVIKLGEYRGVDFFADKVDVRPLNHLYTKFGRNKFRSFEKQNVHD